MADFKDAVRSGLIEYMEGLDKALDGLSEDELRYQPAIHANFIEWIVWHMARVEDRWINLVLRQDDDIWVKDGWYKRFGMDPDDYGREDTAEKMRAMPKIDINEMMDYYREARKVTLAHLDVMPVEDLDKEFYHPRRQIAVSGAWVLGHILVEEAQHLGQIAYIRGMMRGLDG